MRLNTVTRAGWPFNGGPVSITSNAGAHAEASKLGPKSFDPGLFEIFFPVIPSGAINEPSGYLCITGKAEINVAKPELSAERYHRYFCFALCRATVRP